MSICVCSYRVFTEDKQTLDVALYHFREALCSSDTRCCRKLAAPCLFELFKYFLVSQLLVSREVCRCSAHVACALYVVLSSERVDAAARLTELAYEHSHVSH